MKLFMIRHGQTTANETVTYAGQTDAKLTEKGKQQAAAIAPVLKDIPFDKVYSSDLSRAYVTQQLALPGYTATLLPLLREYDVGRVVGMNWNEAAEKYGPFNSDYSCVGGENTDMVCDRVRKFLDILEKDPCDYAAAFCHNGVMKCMLRLILGDCNTAAVENGNCNIAVFEYKNGTWKLLSWSYGTKL